MIQRLFRRLCSQPRRASPPRCRRWSNRLSGGTSGGSDCGGAFMEPTARTRSGSGHHPGAEIVPDTQPGSRKPAVFPYQRPNGCPVARPGQERYLRRVNQRGTCQVHPEGVFEVHETLGLVVCDEAEARSPRMAAVHPMEPDRRFELRCCQAIARCLRAPARKSRASADGVERTAALASSSPSSSWPSTVRM